jgi:hypothetical protein
MLIVSEDTCAQSVRRFRVHAWVNTETLEPMYGVQGFASRRWAHIVRPVGDKFEPILFDRPQDAEAKISALTPAGDRQ